MLKFTKHQVFRKGGIAASAFLFALGAWAAHSQEQKPVLQSIGGDKAQLIVDDQSGVIRFRIDGQEIAWLDANGLQINGNITYSGYMMDGPPRDGR